MIDAEFKYSSRTLRRIRLPSSGPQRCGKQSRRRKCLKQCSSFHDRHCSSTSFPQSYGCPTSPGFSEKWGFFNVSRLTQELTVDRSAISELHVSPTASRRFHSHC